MPPEDQQTREKVRELVRQILRTVPDEAEPQPEAEFPKHVVVNSLKEKVETEFARDESAKTLITEDDLRGLETGARVRIGRNARLTPLAKDLVSERALQLIVREPREKELKAKTVAIAADHGGFPLKEQLKDFLAGLGLVVRDMGTNSPDPVDYPDYAHAAALAVSNRRADIGIIIDGAGIGSAMAANKVPGVRAAACYSPALARNAREHNGANVITLGSGHTSPPEAEEIIKAFLTTEIIEERHIKRVGKIDDIEQKYKR